MFAVSKFTTRVRMLSFGFDV